MQGSGKEKVSQIDSINFNQIVKIFLYIVGFSVIMRCDLWVSVTALIFIGTYLLQLWLLKKPKAKSDGEAKGEDKEQSKANHVLLGMIVKARGFVHQLYEQNVMSRNKQDSKDAVKKVVKEVVTEPPLQFPVIKFDPENQMAEQQSVQQEDCLQVQEKVQEGMQEVIPAAPAKQPDEDHFDDIWHVHADKN